MAATFNKNHKTITIIKQTVNCSSVFSATMGRQSRPTTVFRFCFIFILDLHSKSFNFTRFSFFNFFNLKKIYLSDKVAFQLPNNVRLTGNSLKAILQKVHKTAAKVIILSALEANELIS